MQTTRRFFLGGLIAAPAVVRLGVLMPVKAVPPVYGPPMTATEMMMHERAARDACRIRQMVSSPAQIPEWMRAWAGDAGDVFSLYARRVEITDALKGYRPTI